MPETYPPAISNIAAIHDAPLPAQIKDTDLPHKRFAVAVTTEHGLQVHALETDPQDIEENPYRAAGERTVADLDSFLLELARRPLHEASTIWGNATRGRMTAIYNDHTSEDPGWRDDKLTLALATDEDWKAWHDLSGKAFRQQEFGDRIEELLHTITTPDQATLLEIIDSIRVSSGGSFKSRIERHDGSQKLSYSQENRATAGRTGELEIPQIIELSLKPWDNHPVLYPVEAYFRLRVQEGDLALSVKLKPTRQIVKQAWFDITESVLGATEKPVLAQP